MVISLKLWHIKWEHDVRMTCSHYVVEESMAILIPNVNGPWSFRVVLTNFHEFFPVHDIQLLLTGVDQNFGGTDCLIIVWFYIARQQQSTLVSVMESNDPYVSWTWVFMNSWSNFNPVLTKSANTCFEVILAMGLRALPGIPLLILTTTYNIDMVICG